MTPDSSPPPQPAHVHAAYSGRLRLLGGWELWRGGVCLDVPVGGQRVVAFLALFGRSSRSVLAGTLWPEVREDRAAGNLRSALWRLSRLWPDLMTHDRKDLRLHASITLDLDELTSIAQGAADPVCIVEPRQALTTLCDAQDLLPGWYDDWVVLQRERLRQIRLHALEGLSARLLDQGRYALALDAAMAAVCCEPLRESAHRAVVAVHLAEGNVVEARRYLRWLRAYLRAELGVEPSRHWLALMDEVEGGSRPPVPAQRTANTGRVAVTPR